MSQEAAEHGVSNLSTTFSGVSQLEFIEPAAPCRIWKSLTTF